MTPRDDCVSNVMLEGVELAALTGQRDALRRVIAAIENHQTPTRSDGLTLLSVMDLLDHISDLITPGVDDAL